MQVVIVKAGAEVNKGKYKEFDLAYKKDGKIEGKKFLSFKNPDVYAALLASNEGDTFEVVTEKDEKGYWNWTKLGTAQASSAGVGEAVQQAVPTVRGNVGRVVGSTYETPEERKVKQRYIVRQSSISAAIETLKHNLPKGQFAPNEVIKIAKEYEEYVFAEPAIDSIAEMRDDVPY